MFYKKVILLLTLPASFGFFPALAQDEDDADHTVVATMVVTAEKREEVIKDVPVSITALSAEELEASGVTTLRDAFRYIPNLHVSSFANKRTSTPYIRGIGAGQGDPAVAVYVDGVPLLSISTVNIDFIDMARMEVLRGPQGALYGRNTIGGLVHYITREPGEELHYNLGAEFGAHNHTRTHVSVDGPISKGKAYFSVSAALDERDGFTENDSLGTHVDYRDGTFLRGQLLFTPNDSWKIRLTAHSQEDKDGGFVLYSLDALKANPYHINHDYAGTTDRELFQGSLNATYAGAGFDLTATVSTGTMEAAEYTDLDFVPYDLLRRETFEDEDTTYMEVRLNAPEPISINDNVQMDWIFGVSSIDYSLTHSEANEIRPAATGLPFSLVDSASYDLDNSGLGVFGQVSFTFNEDFDLDLGVRFASDDREAQIAIVAQTLGGLVENATVDESFDEVLPHLGLAYRVSEDTSIYISGSKSYRPGGYNLNTSPLGPYTYNAETGDSFETGFKSSLNGGDAYLSGSMYFASWDNRQLSIPNLTLPGRFYLDNVADSESSGFEFEFAARLNDHWDLSSGVGLSFTNFGSYLDTRTQQNVKGNALPIAPSGNWNLVLSHHTTIAAYQLFTRLEYFGTGKAYYDNANTVSQGQYDLLNARLGIERGGIRIEAFVKNAADETYWPTAIPGTISPGYVASPGAPRTYGLGVSYRR